MTGTVLKEFADLTNLVKAIPHREQKGLFTGDTHWTCIDFTSDWVAVGTDTGWLYLYNRFEEIVKHKLTTQQSDRNPVTKVKLKRSVEYVIAMGTASGLISIFQLPTLLARQNAKLQVFSIQDLHHSAITCLEWSQNAMKLFSGDEDGVVICTEIDYALSQSQSYILCKEPHAIVQLSYAHKMLLVSTRWRTVLCKGDGSMSVTQVGQKERKTLGPFGAIFVPGSFQAQNTVIYCARPNLSLWKADINGTVSLTIICKSVAANLDAPVGISLLPYRETTDPSEETSVAGPNFTLLSMFGSEHLLSYFKNGLFVLNPRSGQFISYHADLPEIKDVSVYEEEVFLLMKSNYGSLRYLAKTPFRSKLPLSLTTISSLTLPNKDVFPSQEMPLTASSDTNLVSALSVTKSLFGALKEIGSVMGSVQNGISSEAAVAAKGPTSPETGQEARDSPSSEADKEVTQTALSSIPIIQLDPGEIAPLLIRPQSELPSSCLPVDVQEVKSVSTTLNMDDTVSNSKVSVDNDIVFTSMRKKKKVPTATLR